jgi:transposase
MLALSPSTRVFVCTTPTDLRKSFDGLMGLARAVFNQDPLAGHLFVFVNRRADSVKILGWDRDGLAIWYKRLERGSFRFNTTSHGHCELTSLDLQLVLAGIDPARAPRQKRFELRAQ